MKKQTLIVAGLAAAAGLYLWQRQRASTTTAGKAPPATPPYMPTVSDGSTWQNAVSELVQSKPLALTPAQTVAIGYRDHEGL